MNAALEDEKKKKEQVVFKRPEILEEILQKYNELNEQYPPINTPGLIPFYDVKADRPLYVGGFTSNSGTIINNALELQTYLKEKNGFSPFEIVYVFSDTEKPKTDPLFSNPFFERHDIRDLQRNYGVHLSIRDIDQFYQSYGFESRMDKTIKKSERAELRMIFDRFTVDDMRSMEKTPEAVILDYYWNLCSPLITNAYLTTNSHAGDLSVIDSEGTRLLKGFHPIREAIFLNQPAVYSTTHIADEKVDNGNLLLRSGGVRLDLAKDKNRIGIDFPQGKEKEYITDPNNRLDMIRVECFYESQLRDHCDSTILPLTLLFMSEGRYAKDKKGNTYFNGHHVPSVIKLTYH